jgi:O-antigen/teichoic acid export membrane protein
MNELQSKFWNKYQLSKELMPLIWVGLHIFANGFVSFLVIAISARKLQTLDLKNFLVSWNIINVSLVVLLSPIEALAPKLLSDYQNAKENLVAMKKQAMGSAIAILIVAVLAWSANIFVLKISEIFAVALFVFAVKRTYVVRAILIAEGKYSSIARMSLLSSFSTDILFQILYLSDHVSVTSIFACISVGTISGISYAQRNLQTVTQSFGSEEIEANGTIRRNVYKRFFQLSTTAFVQIGLGMTGVTVLRLFGGTKSEMVMYLSLAGFCSICFGFVNAASVPMAKSIAIAVVSGDLLEVKKIFFKNFLIYSFGLLVTMIFVVVFSDPYLKVITGTQIEASTTRIVLTVLAIGAECVIVVPKIVLIGIGHEHRIMQIWGSGIVVYGALLFLPIGPYEKVCTAIFVSGIYIFITSTIYALRNIDSAKTM